MHVIMTLHVAKNQVLNIQHGGKQELKRKTLGGFNLLRRAVQRRK